MTLIPIPHGDYKNGITQYILIAAISIPARCFTMLLIPYRYRIHTASIP